MKILVIVILMILTWIMNAIVEYIILKEYFEEKNNARRVNIHNVFYTLDFENLDDDGK